MKPLKSSLQERFVHLICIDIRKNRPGQFHFFPLKERAGCAAVCKLPAGERPVPVPGSRPPSPGRQGPSSPPSLSPGDGPGPSRNALRLQQRAAPPPPREEGPCRGHFLGHSTLRGPRAGLLLVTSLAILLARDAETSSGMVPSAKLHLQGLWRPWFYLQRACLTPTFLTHSALLKKASLRCP